MGVGIVTAGTPPFACSFDKCDKTFKKQAGLR